MLRPSTKLLQLREVLMDPSEFDWRFSLFLPHGVRWSLETDCAVLDSQFDENPAPEFTAKHGLQETLSIHEIQGIMRNLLQQTPTPSLQLRLDAFLFYYERDAYLVLSGRGKA